MNLTILVVDACATLRDMIRDTLEPIGFTVHTANDGAQGLGVLKKIKPDVIVTAINLPGLDGFGFISAVRANADISSIPVLVFTTEAAPDQKLKARRAGATGWIVKPFDETKFIKALQIAAG